MKVSELIKHLLEECEFAGKSPDDVVVEVEYDEYSYPAYDVDSYGGNEMPLVIVIK